MPGQLSFTHIDAQSTNDRSPVQLLAAFDTGNPQSVAVNGGLWFGSDKDAGKATLSSPSYRDVEVTAQPAMIDRGSSLTI